MPPPRRPGPKGSSVKRPSIKAKEDMEKEKDGNDSSGIVTKEEHFTDVTRTLQHMRKDEKQTDLRFLMASKKTVYAHKAIFAPHSSLLRELFNIAERKQPGFEVYISLPGYESSIMEKVLQYLYLGQTTLSQEVKVQVQGLCALLKLKVSIDGDDAGAGSSEDSDVEEIDKKKKDAASPAGKRKTDKARSRSPTASKAPATSSDDESSKEGAKKKKPVTDEKELMEKAKKANVKVTTNKVEKSKDEEVKRYYKRATSGDSDHASPSPSSSKKSADTKQAAPVLAMANPFFKAAKPSTSAPTPTPQKRRMAESDKKGTSKESKKMRQDSESASSSDVDAEAVAKRKKEALIGAKKEDPKGKKKSRIISSDDSGDSDAEKDGKKSKPARSPSPPAATPPPAKKKPGPKKKTVGPASKKAASETAGPASKKAASEAGEKNKDGIYVTESVQYCNDCDAIFLSADALKNHRDKKHAYEGGQDASGALGSDSDSDRGTKTSPKSNKKTPAQIKKERQQSKRGSSSSSSDASSDDEDDKNASSKKTKISLSAKKKPGRPVKKAAADSSDDDLKPSDGKTPTGKGRKKVAATPGNRRQCTLCTLIFDNKAGVKNHVLNHFKEQLFAALPSGKPFPCPDCGALNRDKITLMRHYAFTHKHVLQYCDESDLAGKPVGDEPLASGDERPPPSKKPASSANGLGSAKKPKPGQSKEIVLTSSSDSEDETKRRKEKDSKKPSKPAESETKNGKAAEEKKAPANSSNPVKFSDDSDDDFSNATAKASETAKTFDDLFSGEDKGKEDKKKGGKEVEPAEKKSEN